MAPIRTPTKKPMSAAELRKLSVTEREALLAAAAAAAEHEYRTDPDLTDFEAFDKSFEAEHEDGTADAKPGER